MKQPLPPSIVAALAEVANMADRLAESNCQTDNSCPYIDLTECQDNMDYVAACLTWKELEHAPAMLNAAARAYRQTFPADSLGWEDAGRLQTIAYMIEREQVEQYMKENPAAVADFYHKRENPFSNL